MGNNIAKIDLNTNEWTDKSPEGLAKFVKQKIPNWKKIVVTKYKIIIDPAKKSGSQVISKKTKDLTIVNKNCSSSLSIKVNSDLTNDGKIPLHIYKFFGKDGR